MGRYAVALVLVAIAFAVREVLGLPELGLNFTAFLAAVALAAAYGGLGPGLLAIGAAALLASYTYVPPHGEVALAFRRSMLVGEAVFVAGGVLVCGAIAAMHCLRRKLEAANERVGASRNLLLAIIEGATDVIFVKDAAGHYVLSNGSHVRATGRAVDDVADVSDFDIFSPDDAQKIVATDAAVMRGRQVEVFHEALTYASGEVREFVTTKGPIFDEQGKVAAMFGIARDVTDEKRVQAALRASEEFNRSIVASSSDCIKVLDLEGNLLSMSEGGQRLLEIEDIGRYLGGCWIDFWQEQDRPAVRQAIAAARAGGQGQFQAHCPSVKGTPRWWDVVVTPIAGKDGTIDRVLAVSRDITTRKLADEKLKAAQAEAERANGAKSRFLAAASHDLRQPLSALAIYVGLLGEKLRPGDAALVGSMKDCVGSLSGLLNDLLDLSKLDAGVVQPKVADFAVDGRLTALISSHAPEAQLKGLELRYRDCGFVARTDPVLFERIACNLIANAVRYTNRGGVLVGCRRRGGKCWLEVWDTGVGIPPDKTGEIFEEFKQLGDDARSRGSGLGLAIVARTAALLGLEIRVQSRPGRGSLFAVELPVGQGAPNYPIVMLPRRGGVGRIALVEDNVAVRSAMAYALRDAGHDVVAAASGGELLALLDGVAPDIVVADYRLPGGESGFDVIASARAAYGQRLPAMIVTGDTDPNLIRRMADKGIFIQHKPLTFESFRASIQELLAG